MVENKFLDLEEVTKKNFKECLTYLTYMIDYHEKQEQEYRNIRNK